jgi:kinetochore protein NDC80
MSAIPVPASIKRSTSSSNLAGAASGAYTHSRSHSGSRMSLAAGLRPPAQPIFSRSSSTGVHNFEQSSSSNARPSVSVLLQSARKPHLVNATPARPAQGMSLATPAGALDPLARRSSYFGARPSAGGPNGGAPRETFFATAPLAAGVPTDPRRLRDPSVRSQMASELMEYLTRNNYETETATALTGKTLTSPTQKEFNTLFKWLYHRIDPGYKFQKNMDAEIPPLLKQLRYPFEKSITKSQITAVGGNNWHTFLGVLHWLMQLAMMMDMYQGGRCDYACLEAGMDVAADRIIFDFLSDAYKAWLSVDDDAADEDADRAVQVHVDRMAARFKEINRELLDDVDMLEAEKKSLQERIEELERGNEVGQKLDHKLQLIKGDTVTYEEWIPKAEQRIKRCGEKVSLLEEEIRKVEESLIEAEKERSDYQESLSNAGITIQDLDRMTGEMDRLEKSKSTIQGRVDEVRVRLNDHEIDASKKLDELERLVAQYNSQAYKIAMIPSTAANAGGKSYELALTLAPNTPDFSRSQNQEPELRLLKDATTGYLPHQLLNQDLKGTVRTAILALRRELNDRRNNALEDDLKNRSLLDKVNEAMDDKKSEVEALQHRIRAAEEEHERTKETLNTQKMGMDAQIEKMEKDLSKLRSGLSESAQLMEQKEININIA